MYCMEIPWEVAPMYFGVDPVTTDPKGKIRQVADNTPTLA